MSPLHEIREAFDKVLELEAPERAVLLGTLPEAIRAEVASLLAAHESAGSFLAASEDGGSQDGEHLGPYVLLEKIGQGGMGVVYRARRDDGEFQREVAIKLVGGRLFAPEAERRFIEERRILALLDHPNIVRMIDGGVAKGQRYLVMEFVSGQPVTEYCVERGVPLRERLQLFQAICSAIQYAHQHLILHRDLKPQNILVTPEGQVKVLDFGIARLLDDTAAVDAATTAFHPMTLACASPEQVRGDRLTLASDIYSLGLLLYELLTGTNPQSAGTQAEIIQRIATDDPPAPSRLAPAVSADLDAVALKTLSKEPSRRYASAEEMSADLSRFLENRPILARPPSWTYHATRFFKRNRALSTVAAGLAIAVLAGLGAFLWQAHRAEQQRSIAQRRFDEARRLIYTVIHEIQPKLASINGTVLLRRSLVEQTLVYLDALSKDAVDNRALMRELIEAYVQLAAVSGDATTANTGDRQGATQALDKAGTLANALLRADPASPVSLRTLVHYFLEAAKDATFYGTPEKAQLYARQGLAAAERLAAETPADDVAQDELASAIATLAGATSDSDTQISLYQRVVMIREQALSRRPSDPFRTKLAWVYKTLSSCWSDKGDQRRALDYAEKARALDEEVLAKNPSSPVAKLAVAFDIGSIGWAYFVLSDYPHAAENMRRNVALRESVVAANPGDSRAEDRLAFAVRDLAKAEKQLGERAAERRALLRVMDIYTRHARSGPLVPQSLRRFAMCHYDLGQIEMDAGRMVPACVWFRKASDLLDQYELRAGHLPDDAEESDQVRSAVRGCRV